MSDMADRIINMRYLRLFRTLIKFGFIRATAYPPSFFAAIIGKFLRIGLTLVFFQAIYLHTSILAGWNYSEILVLAASYFSFEVIALATFWRNLMFWLPQRLQDGSFDLLLTKPISPLFYTSFKIIDAFDITASSISVGLLWWYIFSKQIIAPSLFEIGLFLLLSVIAIIFLFSFLLIIASISFWTITATGAGRLFESVFRAARFPGDIFKGPARIALLYILPVGLIVSVPADVLRGKLAWPHIIYFFVFAAILSFIAYRFWNYALRHYSSASS